MPFRPHPALLWAEFIVVFIGVPSALFFGGARWTIHLCLWLFALYALFILRHEEHFSWKRLWHGKGWPMPERRAAFFRFLAIAPVIALFSWLLVPERFFRFPIDRPGFWLVVMVLYPILSVVPQELIFRSFFYERYRRLVPNAWLLIVMNAYAFGFSHIMFHNIVAPTFCAIGSVIFSRSYLRHHSLKWVTVEHAAYGCFLFTAGLGWFFFAHK